MTDLSPSAIYLYKNYTFEDDQSQKDKFTIILHSTPIETFIIHSLTTSQNKLQLPEVNYGCSIIRDGFPYFFIPSGKIIGDKQFSFSKNTFIFFANNIRKEPIEKFQKAQQQLRLTYFGHLLPDELKRILKCALKSKLISKEIVGILSRLKSDL